MRLFTTIKTGYTAGVYGNTGEYYTTTLINNGVTSSVMWHGQYGADYRIAEYLKQKGYKSFYTQANYGQLRRDDILKQVTHSEYEMLKEILPKQVKTLRQAKKGDR